jgi:two-component system phosphate regulon sensor histidine kinase PhoR
LTPKLKVWVDRLINETLRLSNLVEDLLKSQSAAGAAVPGAKPEAGGPTPVDSSRLVESGTPGQAKSLLLQYDGPPEYLVTLDETLFHGS